MHELFAKEASEISDSFRFLFWNIHRNEASIQRIIDYGLLECIDVIALCEVPEPITIPDICPYHLVEHIDNRIGQTGIQVMVKSSLSVPNNFFMEDRRYCILRLPGVKVNLVVLHLPSSLMPSGPEARNVDIGRILRAIERTEERFHDKRTLIVGDFNMSPFEFSMVSFSFFNSILFKSQMMKRKPKTIHGVTHDQFYNPMLLVYNDLGDEERPRGTFFYEQVPPVWHCYDQILMKQSLIPEFISESLSIVGKIGNEELIRGNRPIDTISDHLPIRFDLHCEGGSRHA